MAHERLSTGQAEQEFDFQGNYVRVDDAQIQNKMLKKVRLTPRIFSFYEMRLILISARSGLPKQQGLHYSPQCRGV